MQFPNHFSFYPRSFALKVSVVLSSFIHQGPGQSLRIKL